MTEKSDFVYSHGVTLPLSSPKEQAALAAVKEIGFYKAVSSFTAKRHEPLNYTLVTHEKIVWRTETVVDFQAANKLVFRPYKPEQPNNVPSPGRHEHHTLTYLGLSLFLSNETSRALHGGLICPAEYMNSFPVPEQIYAEFAHAYWHSPTENLYVKTRIMQFYKKIYKISTMHHGLFSGFSGGDIYTLTTFAFERVS